MSEFLENLLDGVIEFVQVVAYVFICFILPCFVAGAVGVVLLHFVKWFYKLTGGN